MPNALQFAIDPDPLLETYHSSVSRSEAETSKDRVALLTSFLERNYNSIIF